MAPERYWIGGTTCSGKSTTAGLLAADFGIERYCTDDTFTAHLLRADPQRQPTMYRVGHEKGWALGVRDWEAAARVEVWRHFYLERFALILDDLMALTGRVVVDGVELFPECVLPHSPLHRAAWLVPTRVFFDRHYYERSWVDEAPGDEVWRYYEIMAGHYRSQTAKAGGTLIEVDGRTAPEGIAARLAKQFGLGRF